MQGRLEKSKHETEQLMVQNKALKMREEGSAKTMSVLQDLLKERQEAAASLQVHCQTFERCFKQVASPDQVQRVTAMISADDHAASQAKVLATVQAVDSLKQKVVEA